jgi:hypothetical protein
MTKGKKPIAVQTSGARCGFSRSQDMSTGTSATNNRRATHFMLVRTPGWIAK